MVHQSYRIDGFRFGVRSTSKGFGEWLDSALAVYRRPRRADPIYSIVAWDGDRRPGKAYGILYRGFVPIVRTLSPRMLARGLIAELDSFSFGDRDDAIYLDAAVARLDGRVALMPSMLARRLAALGRRTGRTGLSLSVARSVAVDPRTGRLAPVRRRLQLSSDALRRIGEPRQHSLHSGDFVVDRSLSVDAVLTFVAAGGPAHVVSRARGLHFLSGSLMNLPRMGARAVDGLGRLVQSADCFELADGDPKRLLDEVVALLSRGRVATPPTGFRRLG